MNATSDDLRSELMPINRRWPIAELLDAVKAYQRFFGRYAEPQFDLWTDGGRSKAGRLVKVQAE